MSNVSVIAKLTAQDGKRADLVLFDLDHPRLEPGRDPVSKIVYTATEADIRQVWVGGKLAVDRGNPLAFDGLEIARRAKLARDAVLERAGFSA